ncbi:MAG: hypothetical protein O6761_02345 [Thaumarchaeota archaeon]|nr:hypothetical protein [Nitrososphaerota archaeon]
MKSKVSNPKLSIFNTFKTKPDQLTGEATRQRGIFFQLASESDPAMKTRTAITRKLAEKSGIRWKNLYSGVFRDLDEILVPLGLVEEAGRLPLRRGPKALQEKGVPYFKLTQSGMLVTASLDEIQDRRKITNQFIETNVKDDDLKEALSILQDVAPKFLLYIFKKYVEAHCNRKIDDLIPLDIPSLKKVMDESLTIQLEFLEGFSRTSKIERQKIVNFIKNIS